MQIMIPIEVRGCPFCGSDPVVSRGLMDPNDYIIECKANTTVCMVVAKTGAFKTLERAIEVWNRRPRC